MNALLYIPIILSLIVFAAHFLRGGCLPVAVGAVGLIALLGVKRPWVARLVQVVLVVAAFEWVRTLISLAMSRSRQGEPFLRMAVILGIVAAVTLGAALLFQGKTLRRVYRLERDATSEEGAREDVASSP